MLNAIFVIKIISLHRQKLKNYLSKQANKKIEKS